MSTERSRAKVNAFVVARVRQPSNIGLKIKRAVDAALAGAALLALSPLLAAVAIAIRIDSPGPILFRQRRGGLFGQPFAIYKFRTLNVVEDGPVIRQIDRDDHRITRVGAFLRRSSIDELPQLLNVLRGEMSLVGPRPHALAHDDLYGALLPNYTYRFAVRPGITGWAQVNGERGPTPQTEDMARRVDYDIWYVENWSLALDVRIVAATVAGIVTGRMCAF